MKHSMTIPAAMLACLIIACGACTRSTETQSSSDPSQATQRPADRATPGATTFEHTSRLSTPLVARMQGHDLGGGLTQLEATLEIRGRIAAPILLRLELPPGATLDSGELSEPIAPDAPPGSLLRRTFVVQGLKGTARLVANATSHATGAHATASYPPEQTSAPTPTMTGIPRTRIGNITIDRAVPIDTYP